MKPLSRLETMRRFVTLFVNRPGTVPVHMYNGAVMQRYSFIFNYVNLYITYVDWNTLLINEDVCCATDIKTKRLRRFLLNWNGIWHILSR